VPPSSGHALDLREGVVRADGEFVSAIVQTERLFDHQYVAAVRLGEALPVLEWLCERR
jgi:hypothetical protein